MFGLRKLRKRIRDLECTVALQDQKVEELSELKKRVKRLECPHDGDVQFKAYSQPPKSLLSYGKLCFECGAVLEIYSNKKEMREARARHYCNELQGERG